MPTTLVAQVDSAYGGKTGVDLPEAKNYVGAYHQPAAVLADPAALETLPAAELAAGFAEVVKTALIAGGSLWERVRAIESVDADALAPLVFDCARTKIEVVAADERDGGRRAVLNLGHTVGHAIEAASGYGATATARRSASACSRRCGSPAPTSCATRSPALLELRRPADRRSTPAVGARRDRCRDRDCDKKRTADGIGFVLLDDPGRRSTHGQSGRWRIASAPPWRSCRRTPR